MTASDGARLHQKRLIIGSSSSGAETGHVVHLAVVAAAEAVWRCGDTGTCVDINYNKRRCNDSADHHCAGTSRLFVANLPTAVHQQHFWPGATAQG